MFVKLGHLILPLSEVRCVYNNSREIRCEAGLKKPYEENTIFYPNDNLTEAAKEELLEQKLQEFLDILNAAAKSSQSLSVQPMEEKHTAPSTLIAK